MGFKEEQFVGVVDENFKCSICYEVMENPKQCSSGNSFCADCIIQCLKEKQECPVCKIALKINNLAPNLVAKNVIESLQVYCHPPENVGQAAAAKEEENKLKCEWTGKLQSLAKHRKTCPFRPVQCPNEGCNTNMQRRELEDHDTVCEYKVVECDNRCGVTLFRHDLPNHISFDCPEVMVPCPNSCRPPETTQINTMKRIDLQDHVTSDCPKTEVDCPYKEQGCGVMVERQDVDKHVQENRDAHMMLLAKECSTLKKEVFSLSEENRLLKDEIKKCNDLLRTYTWKIDDYYYQHERTSGKWRYVGTSDDYPIIKLRSPNFWLCGYNWYLLLYPNGDDMRNRTGYVSVYLYKEPDNYGSSKSSGARSSVKEIKTPNSDVSVTSSLSVMSQKPGFPDFSSQKSGALTNSMYETCVIGWPRFMTPDEAVSETYCVQYVGSKSIFRSTSSMLTLQCTITAR